jgi:hypothetical protein
MIKPVWTLAGVALLGAAGGVWLLVTAPLGSEEEGVQQADTVTPAAPRLTPGPGVTLWRWMDVSVLVSNDSGIRATPDVTYFDDQGTISRDSLRIGKADPDDPDVVSYALIDAKDGTIHAMQINEGHRAEMELVLSTVSVSPLDPATAPWPYNGDPPDNWKDPTVALTGPWPYIPPDPGSGMYADFVSASFGCSGHCPWVECALLFQSISVRNGRSQAFIGMDSVSGAVCKQLTTVHPDDLAAFERFLDLTEQCMLGDAEC